MEKKRIVITGMGTVNPIGNNVQQTWDSLLEGRSGIAPVTRFDVTEYPSKIAGEVKDFSPGDYMDPKDARKMALFSQYAVAAAQQAISQAKLTGSGVLPERIATVLGVGIGGFEVIEESYKKLIASGPSRIPPMTIPKLIANEAPGNVALINGFTGPAYTVTTACASSTDAIGNALMLLRAGAADVVVTGGSESAIAEMALGGFARLQTLSTQYNDTPEKASRPFDKDRDGFVLAEGAGVLIIEELEHAVKRGAPILAELAGYANTCDAYHLTSPHPQGLGAVKAMQNALKDAGMEPEEIDYINAHGTSTPVNDPIETEAIKAAFGDHAYKLKVSSTKSSTGHCVGGAGGVEAVISVLALQNQYYPGTLALENPDPACDLNYLPGKGVKGEIRAVMSNSLGFGGHNSIIVMKEYKG